MTDALSGTVDVPKVGRVKKIYVYGGVAVVGVAAILWWRNHHGSAAASTAGQATDPAGNVGQIDPATGFVYGSPQDVEALASMSGPGDSGSSGGGGGSSSGGGSVGDQVTAGPPFHDNAAWYQYVASYLIGTVGLDPGQVSVDLGKYLAGNQVTVAERDAVVVPGIGAGGTPPVAGPNGFPPSINLAGSTAGGGGGGSAPGAMHLSIGTTTDTSGVVKWAAVSGATGYAWKAVGPNGFSRSGSGPGLSQSITGLTPGSAYQVTVHATNSAGSGPDATITLNTRSSGPTTPPSGSYAAVTVVPYVAHNPPWNSTISGIAAHYGYGSDWQAVWNDPKNAGLRAERGAPNLIRAGDTVQVKRK